MVGYNIMDFVQAVGDVQDVGEVERVVVPRGHWRPPPSRFQGARSVVVGEAAAPRTKVGDDGGEDCSDNGGDDHDHDVLALEALDVVLQALDRPVELLDLLCVVPLQMFDDLFVFSLGLIAANLKIGVQLGVSLGSRPVADLDLLAEIWWHVVGQAEGVVFQLKIILLS